LKELLVGESIGQRLGVDSSTGIAIPVPGATDTICCFEHLDTPIGEPLAQIIETADSGETGANDEDVVALDPD
jgi:hypothetical protein